MGNSDRATSSCSSDSEDEFYISSTVARRRRFQKLSEERQECRETFATLRRLVNAQEDLTQLELLQKIIDYISDLQAELNKSDLCLKENKENYETLQNFNARSRNCGLVLNSKEFKRELRRING